MNCPTCGVKLGKLKGRLVAVARKEETFNPRDNVFAQIVKVDEFTVRSDGETTHDDSYYVCPICNTRFKPKKGGANER